MNILKIVTWSTSALAVIGTGISIRNAVVLNKAKKANKANDEAAKKVLKEMEEAKAKVKTSVDEIAKYSETIEKCSKTMVTATDEATREVAKLKALTSSFEEESIKVASKKAN